MERRKIQKGQVDDLVLLDDLSESAIVANLQNTSKADIIYTWIGPVLVSVNPFKQISGLYTPELIRKYRGRYSWELAPHVYAVAEDTYRALMSSHKNQCILITGESGAGKTEAAKKVMEYVAAVSPMAHASDINIKDRLLQSNPLLEAVGNAKTIRNNNSSRFGKYMEICVDYHGRPVGGRITNYLLEKPRVVSPARSERSFHIFYLLLAGATEQERTDLALQQAGAYASLNQTGCLTVPGFRDGDEHIAMRQAMTQVGFAEEEQLDVLKLVVAILDLLNITFAVGAKTPTAAPGAAQTALKNAARLLSIEPAKLEGALTHRTISARGENIRSPLTSSEECQETAKAFAKAAYARMFTALVERVNKAIEPPGGAELVLGVLDIYGFEIFELNSFEQLCINYCNEKLQQYFIDLTLRAEQEEYAAEGIAWEAVDYFNNKVVCELIEAKRNPVGLLAYLDEESIVPQGTDATFYAKVSKHLASHAHFTPVAPSGGAKDDLTFTIRHYAGDVSYSSRGLLEKNKDQLYVDLLDAAGASRSPYVVSLFPEAKGGATARKRPVSAGTQFRASMADLVTALAKASPHYIRCIKPNDEKKAGAFDVERVTHQVRYLGLLENVRVRRAGYAFRQPLELFASRFKILSPALWPKSQLTGDARAEAKAILSEVAISDDAYKFGKTKIFIRKPLTLFMLEELRARKLHDAARMLQAPWRAYQARKYFLDLREQAQGIFGGRKRRRGSWALYFIGDYIRAQESSEVQRTLTKHHEGRVLFADVAGKVNRKKVTQNRALVITEGAIYTLTPPPALKPTNRVALADITGVAMSTFADGYFVLRVRPGVKDVPADLLLSSVRKAEILTTLVREAENAGRELPLEFSDRLEYRSKKGGGFFSSGLETRTLIFTQDDSLGSDAAVAELVQEPKPVKGDLTTRVRVSPAMGSAASIQLDTTTPRQAWAAAGGGAKAGAPPKRLSKQSSRGIVMPGGGYGDKARGVPLPKAPAVPSKAPPLPPAPPGRRQTFSSFPLAQGLHEFREAGADYLSFGAGAVLHVLEKGGEWWTCELDGKVGLVPSNRVKLL